MKNINLKFNVGDTVMVRKDYGKTFVGIVSGISVSPNKIEYSIKDRYEKYPESRLSVIK